MPRPGRIAQTNRGSVKVAAKQTSAPLTFPAPTQGLVTTASMGAAAPGSASILENWFMTLKGARVRGGSVKRGLAADKGVIRSAFKYKFGGLEKMFMATDVAIYDMTAPVAPPATTAAAVSGMSGWLTPWLLLFFTFMIGCGTALNNPSWQASVGEMVPREDLPAAVTLNSVGFNITRSVGPV